MTNECDQNVLTKEEETKIREDLLIALEDITKQTSRTIVSMQERAAEEFSDPGDRAYLETDRNLSLRVSEREKKLIGKINKCLARLRNHEHHICEACEEFIAKARLMARPVTTLCYDCKTEQEKEEKTHHI